VTAAPRRRTVAGARHHGGAPRYPPRVRRHSLPLLAIAGLAGCIVASCAPSLVAPPRLIAAWPAPGVSLPVTRTTFELTFNRPLSSESSSATISRDEDGSPMSADSVVESANPRRLSVVVNEPTAGQYRLHWHAVAARTGAALDGEQTFAMQDESSVAPRVEVSPPAAEVGDALHVTGTGFGKRCAVQLSIGDDEQALSTVRTDTSGSFVVDARVPQTVPFGQQPVSATDVCGGTTTAAVQVRWGGWPPLIGFDVGHSGPGPGEVTFWVTLRNRSDYVLERIHVVVTDPPDASFVAADSGARRDNQSIVWDIPTMDRGVVGPFRATYRVTGLTTSHAWIEFRHRRPHGCTGDDCLPAFVSESVSEAGSASPAGSTAFAAASEPTATSTRPVDRRSR